MDATFRRRLTDGSLDAASFTGGAPERTPAARVALAAWSPAARPLRGEVGEFLVFAVCEPSGVVRIGGLAAAALTLTVRFEDAWEGLPPDARARSYRCDLVRDPHEKDAPAADGAVRETLDGVAPDARIFLDVAKGGGFLLTFRPEGVVYCAHGNGEGA